MLSVFYAIRRTFHRISRPLTVGVRCIVARPDAGVLLVRHTYHPGWFLPGGGVEKGESLESAVRRELDEEVGVTAVEVPKLFHAYSSFFEGKSDHIVLYTLKDFTIAPRPNLEIAEHGFFAAQTLPDGTSPATRRRLAEWRGEVTPGAEW